jgi:hypothetical protein
MRVPIAANDNIDPNAPLRLNVAAEHAFPFGGMTTSGLRKERDRGRLTTWMIAGKEYTTLNAIEEMLEKCRLPNNLPVSGFDRQEESARRYGSSSTTDASPRAPAAAHQPDAAKEAVRGDDDLRCRTGYARDEPFTNSDIGQNFMLQ